MKKRIILNFLFLGFFTVIAHSQYSVGGGLILGSHSGVDFDEESDRANGGLYVQGLYRLNSKFNISADFAYFYPQKDSTTVSLSVNGGPASTAKIGVDLAAYQGNLEFQYNILNNDINRGYIYVGPSYGSYNTLGETLNHFGGNIGFGVELANNITYGIKGQYRQWEEGITLSKYQVLVNVGYMFPFGKSKETFREGFMPSSEEEM